MVLENTDADLISKIQSLKASRNAVLIAHNYQLGEIQEIADVVGDCLQMTKAVADTKADVIVICGVQFMAETAAILHPEKTVLMPDPHADCPMANMITLARLREKKKEYPNAIVVAYIKSPAAVKAEADVCVTAENAIEIVKNLPGDREILFVPDQYTGNYVSSQTGRDMILWPGFCSTHLRIQARDINRLKVQYPNAKVVVHPECRPEAVALADAVLSTSGIIRFAAETDATDIIVGDEIGILYRLRNEHPEKRFFPAGEDAVCHRMKMIRLETVLWSLENMTHQIKVPERVRLKAKKPIAKMLAG